MYENGVHIYITLPAFQRIFIRRRKIRNSDVMGLGQNTAEIRLLSVQIWIIGSQQDEIRANFDQKQNDFF